MTPAKLEEIRKHDAALTELGKRYNERAAEERRALLVYVDELTYERDKANEHRLAHHDAIIEMAKMREVLAAADAWLAGEDFATYQSPALREAYRAARKRLSDRDA